VAVWGCRRKIDEDEKDLRGGQSDRSRSHSGLSQRERDSCDRQKRAHLVDRWHVDDARWCTGGLDRRRRRRASGLATSPRARAAAPSTALALLPLPRRKRRPFRCLLEMRQPSAPPAATAHHPLTLTRNRPPRWHIPSRPPPAPTALSERRKAQRARPRAHLFIGASQRPPVRCPRRQAAAESASASHRFIGASQRPPVRWRGGRRRRERGRARRASLPQFRRAKSTSLLASRMAATNGARSPAEQRWPSERASACRRATAGRPVCESVDPRIRLPPRHRRAAGL
jgi:hypothetical protein